MQVNNKYTSNTNGPSRLMSAGQPLINPDELPIPLGIISESDGVLVYANDAFRSLVKNVSVGTPLKEFLDTVQAREVMNKKIERDSKFVTQVKTSRFTSRFTITKGIFLNAQHYFVCVQKIKRLREDHQRGYLQRDDFIQELSGLLENANVNAGLCSIEIDRYKVINENYGYQASNFVLEELVKIIKNRLSKHASIRCLGDSQFGIILNKTNIDNFVQICEDIREQVKQHDFRFNEKKINITVSIGVIDIDQQQSLEKILAELNLALRAAQENGRDCVHSSARQDTMMAYHSGKMHYAMVIEDALQSDKFDLFAQPIVDLQAPNNHYSYEVLLRIYDHKSNNYISSQDLITAAESLEVTTRIDQWVCEKVFKQIGEHKKAGRNNPNFSINLSGHFIVSVAFENFLLEMTEKFQVPTNNICYEITESVAVKSITRVQKFIHNLKQAGFKFSLDDFGVGYCSFNYLNLLDVDYVKIDGSFVSAMLDDETQFATVQAINNVARTMNINTVAEFVEKPEIIKALRVIGVNFGQGYIFGKPSPLKDIYQ